MPGFLSIDTTSSLFYTVEFRHPDTGFWVEEATFKPHYKITRTIQPHKCLCFRWETTLTECHNKEVAEDAARAKALRMARGMAGVYDVRVRSCHEYSDYDWWATVWENEKFKDC
jgi:hypothetical protein